jgi:hypothetical protein
LGIWELFIEESINILKYSRHTLIFESKHNKHGDFVIGRRMLFIVLIILVPLVLSAFGQDGSITITTSKSGYSSYSGGYSGNVQIGAGTSGIDTPGTGPSISSQTSQGLSIWAIDINNNHNIYFSTKVSSVVPLLRYSPTGGPVKLYDIWEGGAGLMGTITSINLPAGYSQESYQAATAGRHMLILSSGNTASNAVIVDVEGQVGAGSAVGSSSNGLTNTISGGLALQIINHSIASQVDEETAEVITRASTFSATTSKVYSWLELGKIDSAHQVEWRWISPDGRLYYSYADLIPKPDGEPLDWYDTYSYISIVGEDAANMSGKWHVDIFLDGDDQKSLTEQFTILGQAGQQSSGLATGSMQAGCHTNPTSGQIICQDS